MRTFTTLAEVRAASGHSVGTSDWVEITQERIDAFAESTDDRQWIHVDSVRAASGPFGSTIAHGYLTLSLLPHFSAQTFELSFEGAKLNYGVNRVRFPSPVPVGSRIRAKVSFGDVIDVPSGVQVVQRYVIEIDGRDRPACVAETISLLVSDAP